MTSHLTAPFLPLVKHRLTIAQRLYVSLQEGSPAADTRLSILEKLLAAKDCVLGGIVRMAEN